MKKMIEWAEKEVSRGRKVILFSTVFTFLTVTIAVLVLTACKCDLKGFDYYYYSLAGVASVAIGFYTGTKPGEQKKPDENPPLNP